MTAVALPTTPIHESSSPSKLPAAVLGFTEGGSTTSSASVGSASTSPGSSLILHNDTLVAADKPVSSPRTPLITVKPIAAHTDICKQDASDLANAEPTAAGAPVPSSSASRPKAAAFKTPLLAILSTYMTLAVLYHLGRLRDLYRHFIPGSKRPTVAQVLGAHTPEDVARRRDSPADVLAKAPESGYAKLLNGFDAFFQRRIYRRVRDCVNRPIDSRPSRVIGVMERVSHDYNATFEFTGRIIPAVNLGSYNYLGFAEDTPSITHDVLDCIEDLGVASCSSPSEAGQSTALTELERAFAEFVGKEDAIVCGMGFGTNFRGLPALFGKGTLCISDSLNHSSLVNGVRSSGAMVKVFKHGNYDRLDQLVRESIILGQDPANNVTAYKPWDRIVIIVEGIYSMEGEIVDLRRVVEIKKKYRALLFVDEAHSIGAIGRTGRGVCEHCGVDAADVDVLMGTFTKSFGSIGGYIAADRKLIDYLRTHSGIALHCDTLAPPCCQQIISVLDVILGKDGTDLGKKRIAQLKANSEFFRQGLVKMGLVVLGDDASPVVPVIIFNVAKLAVLLRKSLERGLAVVGATYPATAATESRIRFCVSACHTREDLQYALNVMKDLSEEMIITYNATA